MSDSDEKGALRVERVFPIRIHPKRKGGLNWTASQEDSSPKNDPQSPASQHDGEAKLPPSGPAPLHREESDLADEVSFDGPPTVSTSEAISTTSPSGGRFVSNTFSYHTSDNESASSKNSTGQKVFRCEDEPIHIPGAIQSFGALIAIRENESGRFIVRVVSENSRSITGLEPDALFELRCFTDLLIKSDKHEFLTRVSGLRNHHQDARTNPDVFSLSLTSLLGAPLACFIAMHWNETANLIICEFELKKDVFNPRHPPDEGLPSGGPIHIIDNEAPEAERKLSTTSRSTPLHAVQVARETSRQLGSMGLFHVLCEIQNQLAAAHSLPSLLDIIVGLVYELTSYHRVMVYQFDETAAGYVVSEIVDPRASTDIYRGLKFPASDIPKQARDLYLINKIRVLYDRDQPTARLVCRTKEDAAIPLDLTHSYLRAMSPIHIKYLENMGVRASMSISLTVDDKLWGLISCHSYGNGMRVALPVRELCRALGDLASTNIEKLIYSTRIKARKPLSNAPPKRSPSAYIAASSGELLNMFGADFGFLAIKGEARTIGKLFAYNEAIMLLQYIREKNFTSIFSTQNLSNDCSDISYAPGFVTIAGMLVVPLSLTSPDFLVFFRKGQTMEVKWAGNPHQKKFRNGRYLEPRASFRRWSEHVVGRSREWTEDQVESAAVLSTLYGRFIEVWRQKEAIVQKNKMTRLLIRNAGHEVRTPLNSIINYLEVALEEVLDERARQHLQRSLQASKSLVFQVNDLLNLTEAEESDFDVHEDNVDLKNMIVEVIASFKSGSSREHLEIEFIADEAVPTIVRTDPSMLRQVISNLLTNAIEHSKERPVRIRLNNLNSTDSDTLVELVFEDRGRGMSESELDTLFQEFEQVLDDEENQATGLFEEREKRDSSDPVSLGLGLAMTARFVRLNCGQITISSELAQGTEVSIKIPFRRTRADSSRNQDNVSENSLPTPPLLTPDTTNRMDNFSGQPGVLERSVSVNTILPYRQSEMSQRIDASSTNGAEILATMAQAVAYSTPPTFDPLTGRYPFPNAQFRVSVLIAEDNPLNSRLLDTRLTKRGHDVKVTVDGQACFETFKENPEAYDVILMDIQMPLVDGIEATRLIRAYEREHIPPLSEKVKSYGRIPIIAVSASLSEPSMSVYIESGFDSWILKPIDFQRLQELITGIQDEDIRKSLLYGRSPWNRGGYFKLSGGSKSA